MDELRASITKDSDTFFSSDSPLTVNADRSAFDNARKTWTGEGNVRIQNEAHELLADFVTINHATGDVSARGNITLIQPEFGAWNGESLDYNYQTGAGLIGASKIHVRGVTIVAEKITASTNGLYQMRNAQLTTCTNAPACWHYHIRASRLTYNHAGHSAWFNHATAYFLGVPVAYFPYWYRNLDGYGVRITPGVSTDWGPHLLGAYLYKIRLSENPDDNISGRFRLDYRALRGGAIGNVDGSIGGVCVIYIVHMKNIKITVIQRV